MSSRHGYVALTLLLFSVRAVFAERLPENYERLLLPVLSLNTWRVDLWIRNEGSETVDMFPLYAQGCFPSCDFPGALGEPGLQPNTTLEFTAGVDRFKSPFYVPVAPTYAGGILYVERGKRQNLRVQLRVAGNELSISPGDGLSQHLPYGSVQVPVVSEEVLTSAPLSFLGIRVRRDRYYTLRVYSIDSDEADVDVGFEPLGCCVNVPTQHLRLRRPEAKTSCLGHPCPWPNVPFAPSYAAFFFDTATVPEWVYRISITPTSGARIWAFLSETDATTRSIVIYSP
jgi:hypothetical protein